MNYIWMIGTCLVTIIIYSIMKMVYQKYHYPFFVPVATTTVVLIGILLSFNVSYETYMLGGEWIGKLLGPAVVALALPLYQNRDALKQYFLPIVMGVLLGSTIGILSGILFSILLQIDREIIISLTPKSVTTPIAMDISSMTGGVPTLTAVFVTIAGVSGAMFGPIMMKLCRITHFIGVGVGFGTGSHGIGTARALEIGKKEAAISSIAMILSALYAAIACPIFIKLLI